MSAVSNARLYVLLCEFRGIDRAGGFVPLAGEASRKLSINCRGVNPEGFRYIARAGTARIFLLDLPSFLVGEVSTNHIKLLP